MPAIAPLPDPTLQALCDILGATDSGLTGSEIGRFLAGCGISDPIPQMTKRHRLFQALRDRQSQDSSANNVLAFLTHVMSPVRHIGHADYFEAQRAKINAVLAFCGLSIGEDGQLRTTATARTLSEAEARASTLRRALVERRVHPDVLRFCQAELVADNYFHAVFEATKSVAEKLRQRTGLGSDGAHLVDEALGIGKAGHPRLAFNSLSTESERSEHSGLMNLIKGLFGAFRNTTAHAPRIYWAVTEQGKQTVIPS